MTRKIPLSELKERDSDVACGSCFACCVNDRVFLDPDRDDFSRYDWHHELGMPVLDRKPNGECVYLQAGCSIYETRPTACRRFDCRVWFLSTSKSRRMALVKGNPSLKAVFRQGERLLDTLDRSRPDNPDRLADDPAGRAGEAEKPTAEADRPAQAPATRRR